jgi:glutamate formiminotransferase/formiminotetrahydrofolate cyclodeaminase
VAFNIYLASDNVEIAKKIAKTIRFSSGGLRFLKAMGMLVNGRAQVSMNLTNFRKTPIAQVVELVRREAQRFGTTVHHSELVGLIPQQALVDTAIWYTQLDQFEYKQILENEIYSLGGTTCGEEKKSEAESFLDQLASNSPTPGGGSAAAYTAAEGAALVAMVARLTVGKKKYAAVENEMNNLLEQAENLRNQLTQTVQLDADAFKEVIAAMKMPKESAGEEEIRKTTIQKANLKAAQVPLDTARMALKVLELSVSTTNFGNINAISDAGTASALAYAAILGAGGNVQINLNNISDPTLITPIQTELESINKRAIELNTEIRKVIKDRSNITLW